jgi:hypothetical protein
VSRPPRQIATPTGLNHESAFEPRSTEKTEDKTKRLPENWLAPGRETPRSAFFFAHAFLGALGFCGSITTTE